MSITPQAYKAMSDKASPKSNTKVNVTMAYLTGGGICVIGQLLRELFSALGYSQDTAGSWASITLVIASALLTGAGLYQKLAKHAGAGTLVPITGFANAVSSSAIESSSEGWVLGVGAKIFTIAGPVILYGCAASAVYGLLYYIIV
ncbi:MAG: SpoVA/SpoVAEb family sporulation membrane protein [Ruminococcus sp.]|nr:SpoVA/SpoVAEb family sporulation membrane protein [Ruminococcus sp.]